MMHKRIFRHIGLLLVLCLLLQAFAPSFVLAGKSAPTQDVLLSAVDAAVPDDPATEPSEAASDESSPLPTPEPEPTQTDGQEPSANDTTDDDAFTGIQVVQKNIPGCTFSVEAYDIPNVRSACMAVWTKADKSDLKRFDARRFFTAWVADIDIADFDHHYGTYQIEVFGTTALGEASAGTAAIDIGVLGTPQFAAEEQDASQRSFRLSLTADLPGQPFVWFAVRTPEGEQISCPAIRKGGVYRAFVNIAMTPVAGTYEAAAFCGSMDTPNLVATTRFEVAGIPKTYMNVDVNKNTGQFSAHAVPLASDNVDTMVCAVWSSPDQSDLRWIDMERSEEDWHTPTLHVTDFGSRFGTYWFHAYAKLKNGIEGLACGVEAPVEAENYVWQEKPSSGTYDIFVLNPNPAQDVRAAVWSDANGQDDVVWYPAADEGNGLFRMTALARHHRSGGSFTCHVYAGDALIGATAFDVPASELLSPAQQRIANGCQRVYNAVGTDLYRNYMWVVNNLSYVRRYGHLSPPSGYTREQWYAVEGLEKRTGNCYTYAATFCELARGLGYDAQYVEGAVFGVGQKWWPHGFVLIHKDGGTYICDPELQYASSRGRNLYMQPISSPKATYRW